MFLVFFGIFGLFCVYSQSNNYMNKFKFKYGRVRRLQNPQSEWNRGFGGLLGHLWGRISVNFNPILKIGTVLETGLYYLQFGIKIRSFCLNSKFGGVLAPNLDPHISVKNEDRWFNDQSKDQLKGSFIIEFYSFIGWLDRKKIGNIANRNWNKTKIALVLL